MSARTWSFEKRTTSYPDDVSVASRSASWSWRARWIINLDDEPRFRAIEIEDESPDSMLGAELRAIKTAAAKMRP